MKKYTQRLRQFANVTTALLLSMAATLPVLLPQSASAYGQVTSRQIVLSSSAVSDTAVKYEVSFKPATSSTVKSVAVDFCATSPILNDTCTATVGTTTPTIASATVTTTGGTTSTGGSNNFSGLTWTVTPTNSNRTFTIANASGVALTAGTTYTFTINGVTNHSTNGSFYARLLTFPNDTTSNYAGGYTATNLGTNIPTDAGGIALSLANQLTVTSKIQETITFCMYTNSPANCAAASGTAVTLGDGNGVLANFATTYQATAGFGLASNAQSGVSVRLKGDTLCRVPGSCGSSANTVTAQGASCTADSTTTSVEQFGLRVSAVGTGVTATAPYNCSAGSHTFDVTNTNTTYGQQIASTAGATDEAQNSIEFSAKSATTSEAGIYTSTLTFIATGTY
jgi:hypothetical protein